MSDGPGRKGPAPEEAHPAQLPWLASERLDGEEAAQVRAHLERCAECRRELEALLTMREAMQRHDRTDHVPTIDLVAYHEGDFPAGDVRAEAIAAHVGGCSACAEDLEALHHSQNEMRAAGAEVTTAGSGAWRGKSAWVLAGLAAAALVVVLARPLLHPAPPAGAPDTLQTLRGVTFARPTRGQEAPLALDGAPPWAIRVLLPYGSPSGEYEAAVLGDGGPLPGLRGRLTASEDGVLTMLLPGLPSPGRYTLTLRPAGGGTAGIEYSFEYRAAERP